MGMGFSNPDLRINSCTRLLNPACAHDLMGLGTFLPRHLIPSSSTRSARVSAFVMDAISLASM